MNLDTSRDPSVDSALFSACTSSPASTTGQNPHLQRFSTNSSTGDDEVAVKYNLREQFIDYIPSRQRQAPKSVVTCTSSVLRNGANTVVEGGGDRRGSDLQRQKPIVMRSISGGYESPKNCATSGLQRAATTMATMDTSSSSNNDDEGRKSKSQSMEDEPIMV